MSKYTEYVENNILYAIMPENLTEETMEEFCIEYVDQVNKTEQIKIILDVTQTDVPSTKLKTILFNYLKQLRKRHPEDRVACLVRSSFWKMVAWSIATVTGHTHLNIFRSKQKAFDWLNKRITLLTSLALHLLS